jgi:post-segregation antitoxin (ccd killing protein)
MKKKRVTRSKSKARAGKQLLQAWVDVEIVKELKEKRVNLSAVVRDALIEHAQRMRLTK